MAEGDKDMDAKNMLPPELIRRYELFITHGPDSKYNIMPMRGIHSETIGALITFKGIVIKASDVKPCVKVMCYACEACGFEAY